MRIKYAIIIYKHYKVLNLLITEEVVDMVFNNRLHIVYLGLILANLASKAGKKKNKNRLSLPSFKHAIEVKSSIPGRVRFYVPSLESNIEAANDLVEQMGKIPVIKSCKVNLVTATVLVEYDHENLDPNTLEGAIIKLLGIDKTILEKRVSRMRSEGSKLLDTANNAIYDFTNGILDLKTLVATIFVIYGIKDYRKNRGNCAPGAANLFWWGSQVLL